MIDSGTRSQTWPQAMAAAKSVLPTPVLKARQRAVGAGVRIGADHHVAGRHQAELGQQHVLDADAPDLEVVDDAVLARELAQHLLCSAP